MPYYVMNLIFYVYFIATEGLNPAAIKDVPINKVLTAIFCTRNSHMRLQWNRF